MDIFYIRKRMDEYVVQKLGVGKYAQQKQFLLNHPKRPIIETQIQKEIRTASLRFGARFDRKKLDELILAGSQLFFQLAMAAKVKELMTAAELARHQQKAGEIADTEQLVRDMEKEAMSTAITKAVPGRRDEPGQKSSGHEHQLGELRSDGAAVQPAGRDPGGPGADT